MIFVGIIHPIGHVSDTVLVDNVLVTGIEAGYQTLDVLAALVFGAVLVKSAEGKGYHEEKSRLRVLVGASVVAGVFAPAGLSWPCLARRIRLRGLSSGDIPGFPGHFHRSAPSG